MVALEWPPLWGVGLRFVLALPLILAIAWWRRAPLPARGDRGRLVLVGLFGTGGYLGLTWIVSAHLASGPVALLAATAPLFVALGQRLLGQRMARRAWLGLALGWLGVAVLALSREAEGPSGAEMLGIALALLGALSQAVGLLAFAPARERVDPWAANAVQTAVAAALLMGLASLAGPPPTAASPAVLAALAWSVLAVGVPAYALYFVVLRRFGAANAAALQLLAPGVAAVIGWALLGERLGPGDVAGGAITLLGLWLLFRAPR